MANHEELEQLMRSAMETGLHMRRAQKEYFADKKRSQEKLIAAKRLKYRKGDQLAELKHKSSDDVKVKAIKADEVEKDDED